MSDGLQSIEDLISSSQGRESDDESAESKFKAKEGEIKRKEIERVTEIKAENTGFPYVNLFGFPISPEALMLIKENEANTFYAVCFFYDGKNIRIGSTNPRNPVVKAKVDELCKRLHASGKLYLLSEYSLKYALDLYKTLPTPRKISTGVEITEGSLNKFTEEFSSFNDLQKQMEDADVTDIVTIMLAAAVKSRSSDIHIEAEEKAIKVRFRIDGVLHDVAILDKDLWRKIISRMKVLAKVKINVADKPQDGRISINLKDDRVDIRASFLPTNFGESVVMRLLRSSSVGLAFEELGIRGSSFERLKYEVSRPNGMIITTGPTGSGKTTTLYAVLKKLNNQETKIITVEDPIEYQLEGVNQSQVGNNYTFAQGLRSIVRQDPDVIMVGEIRDLETAEIAIQAALTGHLVLSTIHTNDAAGTVPRFLSMGAKPFLLAPALNAMIGQRLVRRICDKCKIEDTEHPELVQRAMEQIDKLPPKEKEKLDIPNIKFYRGEGCDICQGIGYKGRMGIYEIMTMDEEVEKVVLSGKISEYDMRNISIEKGMILMVQDGILKAADAITSLEEVFRVSE